MQTPLIRKDYFMPALVLFDNLSSIPAALFKNPGTFQDAGA